MPEHSQPHPVVIPLDSGGTVSGLLNLPVGARAVYVLAHGAGSGMNQPFLAATAAGLADRGFGTLRYNFPYMERGSGRPDSPATAFAAVRAAVAEAARLATDAPLFAGGKSFGGRMTSGADAEAHLPGVHGLAFLGFPLHPPGRQGVTRAEHLALVHVPMLFLQGTRDDFANLELLQPVVANLGDRAELHLIEGGDHSFKVPASSGRSAGDIRTEILDALAAWMDEALARA